MATGQVLFCDTVAKPKSVTKQCAFCLSTQCPFYSLLHSDIRLQVAGERRAL